MTRTEALIQLAAGSLSCNDDPASAATAAIDTLESLEQLHAKHGSTIRFDKPDKWDALVDAVIGLQRCVYELGGQISNAAQHAGCRR